MRSHSHAPTLLGVAVLILLYALLPLEGRWWYVSALAGLLAVAAIVPFIIRRLMALESSDRPIFDAINVLALSLSVLVLGFATAYAAMAIHGDHFTGMTTKIDATYFTVVTMATVGFGDITATSQPARLLVTLQILFNLLFVGGAVRLIANVSRQRRVKLLEEGADDPSLRRRTPRERDD